MKNMIRRSLTAAACLCMLLSASAQGPDRRWEGERWRQHLFSQVREDLDSVQHRWFSRGRDQYRIDRTRQQLDQLQDGLVRHRYDERKLDEVIGSLRRVVADNRLSPRDRDLLNEDLRRLQDYREHHDRWGR